MKPIALVGLRCSGKTAVGRRLAARLGGAFRDTDRMVEELEGSGRSAGEVLAACGEPFFRDLEERAVASALAGGGVVALGGGAVERARSRALLAELAVCVWLDAPAELCARRLSADPTPRPALLGVDAAAELEELARRRAPLYTEVADLRVDAGRGDPDEIARRIEGELRIRGLE